MYPLTRRSTVLAIPALLTLAVAAALAQDLPATTTAVAPVEAATAPAATAPASTSATAVASMPATTTGSATGPTTVSSRVSFNFKDASVDAVLNYLSETLGFIVIKGERIDGRVTITSRQPVTADEAVELVNSVLQPLNYTALRSGRTLRIVSRDKAMRANIPVHFGADPSKIKASDDLITQVIPLGQVDATKLRQDLTNMFSPDAAVAANASSNTIVVTDTSANIRHLVEVISSMDKHLISTNDIKVFQLKYASASAAAKLITDLFKPDTAANQPAAFPGRFGRFGPGAFGPPAPSTPDNNPVRGGKVVASSDDRTNTLVVTGPAETLAVIETVVTKLDSDPSAETTFFIYPLKNGQSANLQGVLNTLFGASGTPGSTSSGRATTGFQPLGSSSSSSSFGGRGTSSRTGSTFGSSFGTTANRTFGTTGFGGYSGFLSSALGSSLARANSDLVGQVFVVAEPDTNSLLVTTSTKYAQRVRQIIEQLDRDVPQVLIKVLIAEVTHSNAADIGVEYSILNKRPSGNGSQGGQDFGIASAISSAVASGSPVGLVATTVESNVTAALRALATTGKLDVLSRPSILASDNQLASIMVGQSVPFVTASNITSLGTIVNTVQYQDIGIILNVTPHINPDGLVILDVAPEISQLTGDTVTIQAGVTAPVFAKRSAQSRVAIKNGQTIIIGGLMQDQKTQTVDKIPLLGDIPGVGALFSHTKEKKEKTELLIFLTPIVAFQPDSLRGMTNAEKQGTKLTPNAVEPGTFQEHMQGMQRGVTTQPATPPAAPQPAEPASHDSTR